MRHWTVYLISGVAILAFANRLALADVRNPDPISSPIGLLVVGGFLFFAILAFAGFYFFRFRGRK